MKLTQYELARRMDLSAVRADVDLAEVRRLAEVARQLGCICAFVMPCYLDELKRCLAGDPRVGLGAVVGFPSGACATEIKVAEVRRQIDQGAVEADMVMNVGLFRSGETALVHDDIAAVVAAAGRVPVKVILECHHLSDEQIVAASRLCVRAGAAFVKTGTGWAPTGATLHNVALIKRAVGDAAQVKAAGGVRDLAAVVEMLRLGVARFGLGLTSGLKVFEELAAQPGGAVEI